MCVCNGESIGERLGIYGDGVCVCVCFLVEMLEKCNNSCGNCKEQLIQSMCVGKVTKKTPMQIRVMHLFKE